jgi:hypothetical protein
MITEISSSYPIVQCFLALFRDLRRTSLALQGNIAKPEKKPVMVIERFLLLVFLIIRALA